MRRNEIIDEIDSMIALQEKKLLLMGRRIVPHITTDDLLQPFDYPELENSAPFRYEEGTLHGMLAAKALFLSQTA